MALGMHDFDQISPEFKGFDENDADLGKGLS